MTGAGRDEATPLIGALPFERRLGERKEKHDQHRHQQDTNYDAGCRASQDHGNLQENGAAGAPLDAKESWVPLALQRKSLVAFMITYVVFIIALAVLFDYSNKHNGLVRSDERLHYLWTYGPTAVLTVVAALWTKVDYYSKQFAPWRKLAKGPVTAKQSLSLDYISTWIIRTLISATKARNFDVSLAITASLLLQLIIVFSTGLFALEPRVMTRENVPFTTNFQFKDVTPGEYMGTVDSKPFLSVVAAKQYGLAYKFGTTDEFAYQSFNMSKLGLPSNASTTTTVNAIYVDLDCRATTATFQFFPSILNPREPWHYGMTLNSSDHGCPLQHKSLAFNPPPESGYFATDQVYNCSKNDTDPSNPQRRWWFAVIDFKLNEKNSTQNLTGSRRNETISYRTAKSNVSIVACQPKYEMRRATITTNGATVRTVLHNESIASNLSSTLAWDLLSFVKGSEMRGFPVLGNVNSQSWPNVDGVTLNGLFFSLMNSSMPRKSGADFMDTNFLIEASRKAFKQVATQVALQYMTEPASEPLLGTAIWTENRLVLRPLSFYLLAAILVILTAIAGGLCLYLPVGVVPRDPGSIAGLAAILSSSPGVNRTLNGLSQSAKATEDNIQNAEPFYTTTSFTRYGRHFRIEASGSELRAWKSSSIERAQDDTWWRPFHLTLLGKLIVLIAPLAGIATLEGLYQRSQRLDGIADVATEKYRLYAWVYLPALVVWFINVGFDSVYILSVVIEPYHVMRRTAVSAQDILMTHLLSKILIHNVFSALRKRRFTVLFAALAVLFGAVLPVAVAGLYTPVFVTSSASVQLRQTTWFNASQGFYELNDDDLFTKRADSGNVIPTLVLHGNLSFPRGTYEGFALGEFTVDDNQPKTFNFSDSSISVPVPAVRARLNCTTIPRANLSTKLANRPSTDHNMTEMTVNATLPIGCYSMAGFYPLDEDIGSAGFYGIDRSRTELYYFGKMTGATEGAFDLEETYGDYIVNMSTSTASFHGPKSIPGHCPRGILTFGRARFKNVTTGFRDTVIDLTAMQCWPYVEQVILNTTYSLPDLDIRSANPLPSNSSLSGGFPFFSEAEIIQSTGFSIGSLQSQPVSFEQFLTWLKIDDPNYVGLFDYFMQAVVWGKNGVPATELIKPENADRFIARADEVYSIIMAQLYNKQARIPAVSAAVRLNGTITTKDRYRIVQSLISTRIMQAVLATMFSCCATAFLLLSTTRRLLPQNPCSISAAASYLAGSRLLGRTVMPVGTEFLSDRQMREKGVLSGIMVRLGWWGEGDQKRFGIDINNENVGMVESEARQSPGKRAEGIGKVPWVRLVQNKSADHTDRFEQGTERRG